MNPVLFEKAVIYLKGDRDRQAYENYVRVRWDREPLRGEWVSFFGTHPKAYSALVQDQYGRKYLYILFK